MSILQMAADTTIDTLIFDWSGVVSDDRRPVYEANMRILEEHGKATMTFDEWLPKTKMTSVEFLADHGVYGDPDELFSFYARYYKEANDAGIIPTVYPDVHETLDYLKDKVRKLAVLSSHPADHLIDEAEHYNLLEYFDMYFGSVKDKVEGLIKLSRELDAPKDAVLYIGDTIYDIRSAKDAKVKSAGICTGYHAKDRLKAESPKFLLKIFSDLKEIL